MRDELRVPIGERLLWRGATDVRHARRRLVRGWLHGAPYQLATVLFILMVLLQFGVHALGPFGPVMVAGIVGWVVLAPLLGAIRDWRRGTPSHFVLTDQRLLVQGPDADLNLRLTNLPELRLEAESEGFGSIYFTQPLGASPEDRMRSARWLQRWLPGSSEPMLLLESIPDAARVFTLLRAAQADGSSTTMESSESPAIGTPTVAATQAPVVRESFLISVSQVAPLMGGAFVVIGLVVGGSILTSPIPNLTVFFPGLFVLLGALMLAGSVRAWMRSSRLRAVGLVVPGRVLSVAATGVQTNDVEQWVVLYEYEARGARYEGRSREMTWASAARHGAGDAVRVRYDPARPAESELVE